MKKMKLAHFDDPKWSYKDLCRCAKKYRELLKKGRSKKITPSYWQSLYDLNISLCLQYLTRYNSLPRKALIAALKTTQHVLYRIRYDSL